MNPPTFREWGVALGLFTLLTVGMTWPFASRLRVVDAGDAAYFAWAVSWQTNALNTDPASLPHGNFYAPSRFTFFMDEPVLGTGLLVLPLSWFTDDAVLLFNVARLLTWVLTGLFTWRLARDLGFGAGPALATGAFFALSPIRVDQVSHLSTLGTQWIPLVYLFARRFCLDPNVGDAIRTGLFFALSFLACGYHGLFFALLLPISLLLFLFTAQAKPILLKGAWAVAAAGLFLLPLYKLSREALGPLAFVRSAADTLQYSASLQTFFAANRWNHVWGGLTASLRGDANNLFPGLVVVVLSVVALIRLRRHVPKEAHRFVWCVVVLGVSAALLALGPEIRWFGTTLLPGPFALLRDHVPVFTNIRVTARAGIFVAFALALLAGYALQSLRRSSAVSILALALFLVEARIAPIPTPSWSQVVDTRRETPPVYEWLKGRPKGTVVAELPARPAGDYERPAFHDSIYMVWSTIHRQPLINGYAGAETPLVQRFRATAPAFPDLEAIAVMKEAGVRLVVVHLRGYGPNQRERLEARALEMKDHVREVVRFVYSGRANAPHDTDVVYEIIG